MPASPSQRTRAVVARGGLSAAIVVGALALASAAQAKTGGGGAGKTSSGPALTMTSESLQLNPNPSTPTNCLTEDDFDTRNFAGNLTGSYSTTYQLCSLDLSGVTAGGIGLETDAYVTGSMSALTITAPDGTTHHGVLMGESTSRGVTTYHYASCYVPPYYLVTDTGTNPLAGGGWTVTVSGQLSSVNWVTNAQMTDVAFQQSHCPATEQNLL